MLGRYLTPAVWQLLRELRTRNGVTLHDCIRSGLAHPDSTIGVYAGDAESLDRFELLFAPIIQELHGPDTDWTHPVVRDLETHRRPFSNPDPMGICIRSTRIRLARNLVGLRLMPTITRPEMQEVEDLVLSALRELSGDLVGGYSALPAWRDRDDAGGAKGNSVFDWGDRFQQAAGICRAWPHSRGIYSNQAQNLQVWVNEEDHVRIVSVQAGADIEAVYSRLLRAYRCLEQSLHFQQSARYGYLASCPSNLGTGLRASFHMHLPMAGKSPEFMQLCASQRISVRSAEGENGAACDSVYDISNQRRLGLSSEQYIDELLHGVAKIIALEVTMRH